MKLFKSLLISAVLAVGSLCAAPTVYALGPESQNVGAKLGYVSKNDGLMLGLFYQHRIHQFVRISPELAFVLRHQNLDAVKADINLHVPIVVSADQCCLYPIAGLNYTKWHHAGIHTDFADLSKTCSKLGLNIGAGFEVYTKRNLKVSVEWKYTLTSHFTTTLLDFGVGYFF